MHNIDLFINSSLLNMCDQHHACNSSPLCFKLGGHVPWFKVSHMHEHRICVSLHMRILTYLIIAHQMLCQHSHMQLFVDLLCTPWMDIFPGSRSET